MEKQTAPEMLWVQLSASGGTISYIRDPREVHDNGKPVYQYIRVDSATIAELQETIKTLREASKKALTCASLNGDVRTLIVAAIALADKLQAGEGQ